jgi:hypothetical protein
MHRRSQEIPVTVLGHPPCTGKMTVVDTSGALTISVRIEAKQEPDHLRPLRPLVRRVEKPNVEREVLSIIIRQAGALWWLIVKRDDGHCAGPVLLGGIG